MSIPQPKRWSYTSLADAGMFNRVREAAQLLKMVRRGPEDAVASTIEAFETTQSRVQELTGMQLERRRILEIGPGQQLRTMRCFSLANDVTGIDMDVIAQSLTPREFLRAVRSNPPHRLVKTIVRKALRYDARFKASLEAALGVRGFDALSVQRMDAACMDFAHESFDFVCSYSVFEHIEKPEAALREIVRVLAPGGVAYILTHLWTSNSGHHDPRILTGELLPPYWPHLRPEFRDTVQYTTYCNRLRLQDWRNLFSDIMPGVQFIYEPNAQLAPALAELRDAGALKQFDDDELLTVCLVAVWQKPRE